MPRVSCPPRKPPTHRVPLRASAQSRWHRGKLRKRTAEFISVFLFSLGQSNFLARGQSRRDGAAATETAMAMEETAGWQGEASWAGGAAAVPAAPAAAAFW